MTEADRQAKVARALELAASEIDEALSLCKLTQDSLHSLQEKLSRLVTRQSQLLRLAAEFAEGRYLPKSDDPVSDDPDACDPKEPR